VGEVIELNHEILYRVNLNITSEHTTFICARNINDLNHKIKAMLSDPSSSDSINLMTMEECKQKKIIDYTFTHTYVTDSDAIKRWTKEYDAMFDEGNEYDD